MIEDKDGNRLPGEVEGQISFWDAETETFDWDTYNRLVEARKRLKANQLELEREMGALDTTFIGFMQMVANDCVEGE